jgi:hypothetical protein
MPVQERDAVFIFPFTFLFPEANIFDFFLKEDATIADEASWSRE